MMEENAQMSLLPDAAVAAQMTMTGEEEIDLSEYEIVRPEFFAHIKEPALTVNVDKTAKRRRCENASAKAKAAINGRPIREDAAKADHTTGGGHQGDADV